MGTRRTDVAYALHYLVPFRDRSYWQGVLGLERRPGRRDRMQAFADGYGMTLDGLVDAVLASQEAGVRLMLDLAARGDPATVGWSPTAACNASCWACAGARADGSAS